MKILVTGHLGLIGSIIVPRLEDEGHIIEGYDLRDGKPLADRVQLDAAVQGKDAVVHLAGIPGPWGGEWEWYEENNVKGTQNVIDSCIENNVNRIVYSSSGVVYGMTHGRIPLDAIPLTEENRFGDWGEMALYDRSKVTCEQHLEKAALEHGLTCIALRLETPTPHAPVLPGHLYAQISEDNLGEAFRAALEADFEGFGAFNIGDPTSHGLNTIEWAQKWHPDLPCSLESPDEPLYCVKKAMEVLGYNPI